MKVSGRRAEAVEDTQKRCFGGPVDWIVRDHGGCVGGGGQTGDSHKTPRMQITTMEYTAPRLGHFHGVEQTTKPSLEMRRVTDTL